MSRLIDSEALKKSVREKFKGLSDRCEINELVNAAPTIDAIPMEWLEKKRENLLLAAMVHSTVYGDNSVELCHAVNVVLNMWQEEQEGNST